MTQYERPISLKFFYGTKELYQMQLLDVLAKHPDLSRTKLNELAGEDVEQLLSSLDFLIQERMVILDSEKTTYNLTTKGATRLKWLMVDYFHELARLYNHTVDLFRMRMKRLYEEGSRKIALYAAGESADVAYHACRGSGLQIVVVTDDDQYKQGESFHEFEIRPPDELALHDVDTVLITTCAYEDQIYRRIAMLKSAGVRVERF